MTIPIKSTSSTRIMVAIIVKWWISDRSEPFTQIYSGLCTWSRCML